MVVQEHHSLEELQQLTKAVVKKRIWLRYQAVVLAKQGHSAPAIAQVLGSSRRAVQGWVARYNQGGVAALQERPHTGRPPRLAGPDLLRFQERLEAGPKSEDGVCAATGAASALIMPALNTEVVNLFLEEFSRGLPAGVHAVLIWDGAGFHTGADVVMPSNVSLIQLPPYSPELNPVENLWHYLRAHHWSNREYEGYKGLQEEAVRSLRAVCQDDEKLKTICHADYVSRRA